MSRTLSPQDLEQNLDQIHLIDVRRANDRVAAPERIRSAEWHDPEQIANWADGLPRDRDIVLYCVRGGSVSNGVVDTLQAKGYRARFIEGGLEGWKAAGGAVVPI